MKLFSLLAVFIGSGLGGSLRWIISSHMNGQRPWGTLAVNVLGCLVLGILTRNTPGNEHYRLLLMTGFCGGFTTFSTFAVENMNMMRSDSLPTALAYVAISLILGLAAAWIGYQFKLTL